ncbi:hypothetical protein KVG29_08835 [Caldicoprobacter algeriensis]|uniref:HK97 gp10 family phage protein n=1 Tax=Caldicoprobacter algeriensis TaxID=699281 RepID=UPI0020798CFD|nr:HK97 gp10 family phage protein [Caldicoprobacter algeriensis]MCM8901324.1 hypothetical protein [Caldicoprobacter algeriensis]
MAKGYVLKWRGDEAKKVAHGAGVRALYICAADLQGKSANQAPIDTGDLKSNCSISPLKHEGTNFYYTVGYDLPYAKLQHERLDFNHPKGGKAKYLEDPFNENKARYDRFVKKAVKQALKNEH